MAKIIIVNNQDEIIGCKDRDALNPQDIYRVSALWITNSKGEILLAQRHHTKKHNPLKWGPAVAGTVEEGETYEKNIIKETKEELGLKNIKPIFFRKTKTDRDYPHFTQSYALSLDQDINEFKIQEDEVEAIRWFTPEELKHELKEHPEKFLSSVESILNYLNNK